MKSSPQKKQKKVIALIKFQQQQVIILRNARTHLPLPLPRKREVEKSLLVTWHYRNPVSYIFAHELQPITDTGRIAAAYVNNIMVMEIFGTNLRRFSRGEGR